MCKHVQCDPPWVLLSHGCYRFDDYPLVSDDDDDDPPMVATGLMMITVVMISDDGDLLIFQCLVQQFNNFSMRRAGSIIVQ